MKYIPKYITTDILAEYGEHLTHEAYNEMVKLNITQGDYNTTVLNQLFNTDEGIQIPYLDNKIKKVTDDQAIINEDMDNIVAEMIALKGSLSKYTTFNDVRRIVTESTQGFVKTNKIKAGENVEVVVDANNNVIISATGGGGGGDVTKSYVDEQDAATLQSSKGYTDTKISQIPIPVVPTDISAFNNDVGYITGYTETDPIFSASAAAGITSEDITSWNNKSDFSGNYADLNGKPDLSVYVDKTSTQAISGSKLFTTIPQTNKQATENNHIINKKYFDDHIPTVPTNISAFNNDSGYLTSYTETDPVFSASPAAGITATDITNWDTPEVRVFNIDPNEVIDILGLKKGLYIVIGDTSASSPGMQKLCYSPFRQGTSSSNIALTGGYFYVTQDITNNLPNESTVINYIGYGAYDSIINLKIDNTKLSGIEVETAEVNSYVTISGSQVVTGNKTFNSTIRCNGTATAYNHLTRLSDVYKELSSEYDANNTYNTGDYTLRMNKMYVCKADNVTGSWDSSNWEDITSSINALNRLKQYVDAHSGGGNTDGHWWFDITKQPNPFGTTDALHFYNCNRFQSPFVFDGKSKGMYFFAPMGYYNNSLLPQCLKGTSSSTSILEVDGLVFLLIIKDYTSAVDSEDIAVGWGFNQNGPVTYSFKKSTSAATGLTRTNQDYFSSQLYVSLNKTETVYGTKTFNTTPILPSSDPNNLYNAMTLSAVRKLLGGNYSTSISYEVGDYTWYQGRLYRCTTANSGAWSSSNWTEITQSSGLIPDLLANGNFSNIHLPSEVHYVADSDLINSCFILKGKTKGIYLFTHAVGLLYDSTNTPSQTNPEVCRSGILWLSKDVDPSDTTGGIVGAMVSHAHSQNGETYVPSDCTMIITAPTMPSTMSGVVLSGGTGSPVNAVTPDVIAPNYSWQNTYNTGDLVTYNRKLYQCNSNNVTGSWNSSYWTQKTLADLL